MLQPWEAAAVLAPSRILLLAAAHMELQVIVVAVGPVLLLCAEGLLLLLCVLAASCCSLLPKALPAVCMQSQTFGKEQFAQLAVAVVGCTAFRSRVRSPLQILTT
jgi:hypothetical protein